MTKKELVAVLRKQLDDISTHATELKRIREEENVQDSQGNVRLGILESALNVYVPNASTIISNLVKEIENE